LTHFSETTTHLIILQHDIDHLLNEWIAEQRDPTLSKSNVINLAIQEFFVARGRLDMPGPQQIDADMMKLLDKAYPDATVNPDTTANPDATAK
jgi:hypothetical protein